MAVKQNLGGSLPKRVSPSVGFAPGSALAEGRALSASHPGTGLSLYHKALAHETQ